MENKYRKLVGNAGEDLAELFLENKGYRVLQRNFRCKFGEIDIIARKNGVLFFVEVKTRFSTTYGSGREAVDNSKVDHIKKCAEFYITKVKWTGDIAFHVIEIHLNHITCPI